MKPVFRAVSGIGTAIIVIAAVFWGTAAASSAGVGVALALVNLAAFVLIVKKMAGPNGSKWAALGSLKLVGLLVVVTLLFASHKIVHLALLAGYMALPLGVIVGGLFPEAPEEDRNS